MASNIDSTSIDADYPVAGRDNDTQGFRDNFSTIKNSLAAAKAEIEDIQSKAVLKDALTGATLENNMAGSAIIDADLQLASFKGVNDGTSEAVTQDIDFENGHYQKFTMSTDVSYTLLNFPTTNRYATLRVELVSDNVAARTATFIAGVGTIKTDGNTAWTGASVDVALDTTVSTIVEFFTNDGGVTVFARYIGQFG